jgi:hypothetical protein
VGPAIGGLRSAIWDPRSGIACKVQMQIIERNTSRGAFPATHPPELCPNCYKQDRLDYACTLARALLHLGASRPLLHPLAARSPTSCRCRCSCGSQLTQNRLLQPEVQSPMAHLLCDMAACARSLGA